VAAKARVNTVIKKKIIRFIVINRLSAKGTDEI